MITWNGLIFHNGSTNIIEGVVFIHDYAIIFLLSILILITYTFLNFSISGFYRIIFYENHSLENCWTLAPFLILFILIIPSLSSLYVLDSCFFCGMCIKVVGHQWYWSYFYRTINLIDSFDSYISTDSYLRLLDVDNRLLVPLNTPIRFLATSVDVIHSWTLPSFGLKIDAIPGRLNQTCTLINRPGVYFGQCSEICGANHRFMPIVVEVQDPKLFL